MDHYSPMLAAGVSSQALSFAWKHLTKEGLFTILALLVVSIFSWTVIITKGRQLFRARRMTKKFFAAYLYYAAAEETEYHLKNNPVLVRRNGGASPEVAVAGAAEANGGTRQSIVKISQPSFESVRESALTFSLA